MQRGPGSGTEFILSKPMMTIGRSTNNDIVIADAEMSRQHAQIVNQGGNFLIEDLGSTNGTFVNGQRVNGRTTLYSQDTVEFGETIRLLFVTETAVVTAAPTSPSEWETSSELVAPSFESVPIAVAEPTSEMPQWLGEIPAEDMLDEEPGFANSRRWLFGMGCGFLVLIFLCIALFFFLDAYDNGRLLYCGPLNGLFQILLGPFGFSPACA
jgi:predicted component of type VI protein secretion system